MMKLAVGSIKVKQNVSNVVQEDTTHASFAQPLPGEGHKVIHIDVNLHRGPPGGGQQRQATETSEPWVPL
jgi:hypothetical protein